MATEAKLSYLGDSNRLKLEIWDNGLGFDRKDIPSDRMGLRIMEERCESIHAQLNIESVRGNGTHLAVVWADEERENHNEPE